MSATIDSHEALQTLLSRVSVREPFASMRFGWGIRRLPLCGGWLVRAHFDRPCSITGMVGRGASREEYVSPGASVSSVVKTCWLLVELTLRHEAMEAFHFDDARIFDPHHDVADLALVGKSGAT